MSKVSQAKLKEQEASIWTRKVYHIPHGNARLAKLIFSSRNIEKGNYMVRYALMCGK